MLLPEKCTASRGRSGVPLTRLRMRVWRIAVWDFRFKVAIGLFGMILIKTRALLHGLAFLAADLLARVTHALAFVRLGRVIAANIRGNLSDEVLVAAFNLDLRRLRHRDLDAD